MEKKDINRFRWWSGSKMYNWQEMKEILVSRGWIFDANGVVMSNTGYFSKSGIEVHEGDIVEATTQLVMVPNVPFIGEVKYLECAFLIDNGKDAIPLWSDVYEVEILGNIHQQPELLK